MTFLASESKTNASNDKIGSVKKSWRQNCQAVEIIPLIFLVLSFTLSFNALAADPNAPGGTASDFAGKPAGENKASKPEEDDYSTTPFTEYGEFNNSLSDEEADTRYFQYGRFFGVSAGAGFELVDGNRGALWQGGFPTVDVKLHYWFDFNIALDLGFYTASHYYDTAVLGQSHVDVNMLHVGIDIKYYFDTKNLSAAITFANPYILLGAGSYTKTQNSLAQQNQDTDTSVGVAGGAGLEFAVVARKTFFTIEGKMHFVNFKDTFSAQYQNVGLPNLTGYFYTFTGSFLFTF